MTWQFRTRHTGRVTRPLGWLVIWLLGTAGCTTQVRVLDDATGLGMAGVIVTPVVSDLIEDTVDGKTAKTDAEGRATIQYREGDIRTIETNYPGFRAIHRGDKSPRDERGPLLYMRRQPRVVLEWPNRFAGPAMVTTMIGLPRDPWRAEYRITVHDDVHRPTAIEPAGELVDLNQVEVERDGIRILPAPRFPVKGETYVWIVSTCVGLVYEEEYIDLMFVGTVAEYAALKREVQAMFARREGLAPLGRERLDRLIEISRSKNPSE